MFQNPIGQYRFQTNDRYSTITIGAMSNQQYSREGSVLLHSTLVVDHGATGIVQDTPEGIDLGFPRGRTATVHTGIRFSMTEHAPLSPLRDCSTAFPLIRHRCASLWRCRRLEQLPYDQETSAITALNTLDSNEEVAQLRNEYGADLVQLVGRFYDYCGYA